MKRLMIGLAAVMMSSAAWTQAPAQETATGLFACTAGVTSLKTGHTQVLTTTLKTVDACRSWALDATHLDANSGAYELLVHDEDGKVVLHQACRVQGLPLLGTSHSAFPCKDVAA